MKTVEEIVTYLKREIDVNEAMLKETDPSTLMFLMVLARQTTMQQLLTDIEV